MEKNSFKRRTIAGLQWNFVNQFGVQFLNLLFSIFLARLLSPTEYGLIAMVTVFTGFSSIIIDFGFGNALIHKKEATKIDWSSVFWLNLLIGSLVCIVFILSAGTIASFYEETIIEEITIVLSFTFIATGASVTSNAFLKKQLKFKSIALANLLSIIISGALGIYLALHGFKVWSLVAQRLSNVFLKMILLFFFSKNWPTIAFSIESIKGIFSYSTYIFMSRILSYGSRNLDNLLIGKFLSSADLGIYNRAYSFLMFPIKTISSVINTVMFPSFSQINNDRIRIKSIFLRTTKLVSFVIFPMMLIFNLGAESITMIVFGEKWIEVVPFLKLFAFLGINQTFISLNGPLYLALDQTKMDFKIGLFTQSTNILAIIIGINWGLYGVIYGLFISSLINYFPVNYFIFKQISLRIVEFLQQILPAILVNGFIYFFIILISKQFNFSHIINLTLIIGVYGILYLVLNLLFKFFDWKELKGLLVKNEK